MPTIAAPENGHRAAEVDQRVFHAVLRRMRKTSSRISLGIAPEVGRCPMREIGTRRSAC
jgi:hypothetical protein